MPQQLHAVPAVPMDFSIDQTALLERMREADYPDEEVPAPRRSLAEALAGTRVLAIDGQLSAIREILDSDGRMVGLELTEVP